MSFYAGYSEANRIPTPLELGCSNPLKPCLLEGFLVSDPPLQQVVARTREAGLRGNINTAGGRGDWKLGLFRLDTPNEHIQVASTLQSRGVFQHVPAHEGAADLRVHKQPVQSQVRDFRHFLRSAVDGRDRDTERAVRPPHGYAGAAALGLCGNARKAVRPNGQMKTGLV